MFLTDGEVYGRLLQVKNTIILMPKTVGGVALIFHPTEEIMRKHDLIPLCLR